MKQANKESAASFPSEPAHRLDPGEAGRILYRCHWTKTGPMDEHEIAELEEARRLLYERNLIGIYPDGIGFGNLSRRSGSGNIFLISGTQTGGLKQLSGEHYSRVTSFDFAGNALSCAGPAAASSEALSHAALYVCSAAVMAVVHVHHDALWARLQNTVPTTDLSAPPGTPEMALEIERLFRETNLPQCRLLVMGGHKPGLMTFGATVGQAAEVVLDALGGAD